MVASPLQAQDGLGDDVALDFVGAAVDRGLAAVEIGRRDLGHNAGVGPDYAVGLAGDMFNGRKTSIYGGSNEIQRNIIAKMVLGL